MLQTIKNPEKLSHLTIQTCLIAMFLSNISSPFLYKIGISATNKGGPTGCKILLQVKCKAIVVFRCSLMVIFVFGDHSFLRLLVFWLWNRL